MRAPVGVVPPLAGQIQPDLGLNAVQIGLLTSIPVACFGLLTPVASYLLRVLGINHAAVYCLLAVIAGSLNGLTTTLKLCVALRLGEPLSATTTLNVLVESACVTSGRQPTMFELIVAPVGFTGKL